MSKLNPVIERVTNRIVERSKPSRDAYLELMQREADRRPERSAVSCSVLAHAFGANRVHFGREIQDRPITLGQLILQVKQDTKKPG